MASNGCWCWRAALEAWEAEVLSVLTLDLVSSEGVSSLLAASKALQDLEAGLRVHGIVGAVCSAPDPDPDPLALAAETSVTGGEVFGAEGPFRWLL